MKHAAPISRSIFKIAPREEWEKACGRGVFQGLADDIKEGFIHLSARHQLAGTLAKHFRAKPDLLLIAVDAATLGRALRWETSREGDLFPHLYAPLPTKVALWTHSLRLGPDGFHVLPEGLREC